jgi:hypothetical protein
MSNAFKIAAILSLIISQNAFAGEAPTGQNAFTRAVQKPLEDIVTPVPNTDDGMCNSVIECRKYGGDLKTKWQMKHSTDFSPRDYPDNCYVPGRNGKYVFSATSCAKYGKGR